MRRSIALFAGIAIVMVWASRAVGAAGTIDLFSDPVGGSCIIADHEPGPLTIYVLHRNTEAVAAAQFAVVGDPGFTASFLSMTVPSNFLFIGTPEDLSIAYQGCLSGSFLIATLTYQGYGTSTACSHVWVRPAPTSPIPGEIAVLDECSFHLAVGATWGPLVVNYLNQCPAWCIVATEPTSWGKIKALYR